VLAAAEHDLVPARHGRSSLALGRPAGRLVGAGVVEVRSRGLWAGIDVEPTLMSGREMSERMLAKGVLVKDTHGSTIRLAPALVIEQDDLEWMVEQLGAVLDETR